MEKYMEQFKQLLVDYAPKFFAAIAVLIIGLWVIKYAVKAINRGFEKREIEPSLRSFLRSMIAIGLKALLFISVLTMVGIEMTSFIAILGAAGLAIGMALSGTLQNFAGGVIILLLKPFRVGHVIEAQGYTGSVNEIQIFSTILKTPDNKTIIIPNGPLSTGSVVNYSTEAKRRIDITFGISYDADIKEAKSIILDIIQKDTRIDQDPEPFLGVVELADNSVNIVTRSWVNAQDYWGVYFDLQEKVKYALDKAKIGIPYPQIDLHLHKN